MPPRGCYFWHGEHMLQKRFAHWFEKMSAAFMVGTVLTDKSAIVAVFFELFCLYLFHKINRKGTTMSISGTMIWVVGIVCVVVGMYALATSSPKKDKEEFWMGRLSKKLFSSLHML
jgi:hypothetical protein